MPEIGVRSASRLSGVLPTFARSMKIKQMASVAAVTLLLVATSIAGCSLLIAYIIQGD